MGLWVRPEQAVQHRAVEGDVVIDTVALDSAFPDPNCDRTDGGRWVPLRHDLEKLVGIGFGIRSPVAIFQWRDALAHLRRRHGYHGWLQPVLDENWVDAVGVIEVAEKETSTLPCPLGVATILTASFAWRLADIHIRTLRAGEEGRHTNQIDSYWAAAEAVKALLLRAMKGSRFVLAAVGVTRWPLLDLLAALEAHVLGRMFRMVRGTKPNPARCLMAMGPSMRQLLRRARHLARFNTSKEVHGKFPFNKLAELCEEEVAEMFQAVVAEPHGHVEFECIPAKLMYNMIGAMISAQNQGTGLEDREDVFRAQDVAMRKFLSEYSLASALMNMNFASFPVFGLWRQFRHLAMHRYELPFASPADLGRTFRLSFEHGQFQSPETTGRFSAATAAFDALKSAEPRHQRRVALLSAFWGRRYSGRLRLWLRALRRVGVDSHALVLCQDKLALAACRSEHRLPELCADALDWPQTLLSKLSAISMCLSRGIDALWLDSDAIVLRNPLTYLDPISSSKHSPVSHPDMLFSIEPHSWNCVVAGVFFTRATRAALRFLAFWISLYLDRPFDHDQLVLHMVLGLLPEQDWPGFAENEGLLSGSGRHVRALGTLRTPDWGALDAYKRFVIPQTLKSGGMLLGHAADVAVLHVVESWPKEYMNYPVFAGVQDPVGQILFELVEDDGPESKAMALVRRVEHFRAPLPTRFNCRTGRYEA